MQTTRNRAEYPSRSVSPYSYTSSGTRSPAPTTSYESRNLHHTLSHPTTSSSSRTSKNRTKNEMYPTPTPSSNFHPSLTTTISGSSTPLRHSHSSSVRSHPYRSSSRASTTSSGIEDVFDSDNDWDSVSRKDSIHSIQSTTRGRRRASMTQDESSSYTASLSSPTTTTSSPTFTFIPQQSSGGKESTNSGPLSLNSLPTYPPDQKPPFSYPVLIRLAILGSPQKRLLLNQIYTAIEEKFPWYKDSAPKAWKASVRHCLSLNKEFVRIQRAVEDPGVGCGGWWSVGEGMKGLKRPRKRRPAQNKRGDEEESIKEPLRRRHSVQSNLSNSPPPIPSLQDYSLQLAPLQLLSSVSVSQDHVLLPSPSGSRPSPSGVFNFGKRERERGRSEDVWEPGNTGFGGGGGGGIGRGSTSSRGHSHTSTPSTCSSYSAQSRSDTSSLSGGGGRRRRQNPMNISNLLNEGNHNVDSVPPSGFILIPQSNVITTEQNSSMELDLEDVEMKKEGNYTPFSSDQTLRPPSPPPPVVVVVPSSKSSSPSRPATSNVRNEKSSHRERTFGRAKTPLNRRPASASGETSPPLPIRRSPNESLKRPVPSSGLKTREAGSSLAKKSSRTSLPKKERNKAWDSVMDLSKMITGEDED